LEEGLQLEMTNERTTMYVVSILAGGAPIGDDEQWSAYLEEGLQLEKTDI
jgi:hypothetical protein